MLKIEEEQEKYRKLMQLAEELCIENFNFFSDEEDFKMENENEENKDIKILEADQIFKRQARGLEGIDPEEILKLKALCHVNPKEKVFFLIFLF